MANRHGFICGATGTGKTVTLKVLAESFSAMGVPVFLADVKGDLSGMSQPGQDSADMQDRAKRFALAEDGLPTRGSPPKYFDIYGKRGIPLRTTVSEIGPQLLAGILGLNKTQADILSVVYKLADDENLLLCDTKDLKAILQFASENAAALESEYGRIANSRWRPSCAPSSRWRAKARTSSSASPRSTWRISSRPDPSGKGTINVLDSAASSTSRGCILPLCSTCCPSCSRSCPKWGIWTSPGRVFFDEAHLLFDSASSELMEKIEQMIKLIRSKGVGVYFITQSPGDIPDAVASQLGNKIEHGLRAYTPAERKVLKAAAESFRENPAFDTMELLAQLGTGEAVVSMLDEKGVPGVAQHVWVLPPESYMGLLDDARRDQAVKTSNLYLKYSAAATRTLPLNSWSAANSSRRSRKRPKKRRSRPKKSASPPKSRPTRSWKKSRSASAGRWSAACGAWPPPRRARWAASWAAFWAASSVRSAKAGRQRGGQHRPQPAGHAVQALSAAAVHLHT